MLPRRAVLVALAASALVAPSSRLPAQSFCNTGAVDACISVGFTTTTSSSGLLRVFLDVIAPEGLTVQEIVMHDLLNRGVFGGLSTHAFFGSFVGTFTLSGSFQMVSAQERLGDEIENVEEQIDQLHAQLDQLSGLIEQREDEFAALEVVLEQCMARDDLVCVNNTRAEMLHLQNEIQTLRGQHQLTRDDVEELQIQRTALEGQLEALGTEPVFPTVLASELSVASWTGTMPPPPDGGGGGELPPISTVPEPATIALMGTGLAGLAGWRARRRNRRP